jgi:hypothetical protein
MKHAVLQTPGLLFLTAACQHNQEQMVIEQGESALITGVYAYADLNITSNQSVGEMIPEEIDQLFPLRKKAEERRLVVLPQAPLDESGLRRKEGAKIQSAGLSFLYAAAYDAFYQIKQDAQDKKVVVRTGNWATELTNQAKALSIAIQMIAAQAAQIDELHYIALSDGDKEAFKDAENYLRKLRDEASTARDQSQYQASSLVQKAEAHFSN